MNEVFNDINELEKVRTFLLKAKATNCKTTATACNDVAFEKLNKIIKTKIKIIEDFEEQNKVSGGLGIWANIIQ